MNTKKINTVIDSIDNIKQAEVSPYFETRLRGKMERRLIKQDTAWFIVRKPAYIIASLIIFSTINLYLISINLNKNAEANYGKIQPSTIEGFTNDYQLITNPTY